MVGEMRATSDSRTEGTDPKAVVVEVAPMRALGRPVTLAEIKADTLFADWELVRQPRLSVMPVTRVQWRRIEELSEKE
jgi:predicted RNA-binding protein with PUA-like domain